MPIRQRRGSLFVQRPTMKVEVGYYVVSAVMSPMKKQYTCYDIEERVEWKIYTTRQLLCYRWQRS